MQVPNQYICLFFLCCLFILTYELRQKAFLRLTSDKGDDFDQSWNIEFPLGQRIENDIFVYQAFNPKISGFAVSNQKFGGEFYKFSRMSWIKPNFLWMMYRAGWARKEDQQKILAIRIGMDKFLEILSKSVHSSFKSDMYTEQKKSRKNN